MRIAGDVDEQVAEQAVDEPRWSGAAVGRRHLGERDLKFVEPVVPSLVDPWRLARGSDEEAGEEIGQRRMSLPVEDQALEQVGAAQKRRVGRRAAAEHT